MSEKYQFYPYPPLPPLIRGGKLIKVPLFKGDLGGYTSVLCNTKKFSDILLELMPKKQLIVILQELIEHQLYL
ncbi:hypothetical protein A2T98_02490 [Nodularia spumigena CENA596]|uniref:Uncharacterized protein n=1 Tax=Nodularia spumigena CENA596 TaxID=1819295 RepID=A0A166KN69_NODSP|nr:hypothetical protein A2T98_02490 [Nodularia spumigena CENA596]